ncbi:MAG: hypothetical protein M3O87_00445 [Candidatus Dormibacteraeota bacterium]|nr:hypothetical protein [Candidatus Dormibacteraeota bacterium]
MSASYRTFAGIASVGAALSGFLYAVAFVIVARSAPATGATLAGLFLMTTALLATAVMAGLYRELRDVDSSFALWAVLLGVLAMGASAAHGGYDLANGINPPSDAVPTLPSQVDPRGLMTFGVAGLAILVFSWLIQKSPGFPNALAYVGYLSALLVEVLYLGRLVILDATNPVIVVAALAAGFVVNPLWYAWLGVHFLRASRGKPPAA